MRQLYHISVHHSACRECKINSAKIRKNEQKLIMNNLLTTEVHDLISQVLSISTGHVGLNMIFLAETDHCCGHENLYMV